jgi:hypothetical protein
LNTMGSATKDLEGRVFGGLTVVGFGGYYERRNRRYARWSCRCECGSIKTIRGSDLTSGRVVSCGCRKAARAKTLNLTHGRRASKEYRSWCAMIARCTRPANVSYPGYGGRGITVCQEWRDSFETFVSDVGPAPSPRHSLDRIDANGNYEPGNCRWATMKEQARNTRRNRLLTLNGETLTMAEWAERLGTSPQTLAMRLKLGWTHHRVLTFPFRRCRVEGEAI